MVLLTQAKAAHWNVKGMNFYQLHRLFDDVAQMFFRHSDEMAERITTLGGQAIGTVHAASRRSSIPPLQRPLVTGPFYVATLADHIAIHDAKLSQDIERATQRGDVDTADLLNEISREVSKHLWFLEAHLQTHPLSHRHRSADQPGPSATGLSL
jgi:starvation-inducible DNA-binding protein